MGATGGASPWADGHEPGLCSGAPTPGKGGCSSPETSSAHLSGDGDTQRSRFPWRGCCSHSASFGAVMRGLSPCLGFGCSVSVHLSMPSVPPSSDRTSILIQARTLLTLSTCHTVLLSTNAGQGLGMSVGSQGIGSAPCNPHHGLCASGVRLSRSFMGYKGARFNSWAPKSVYRFQGFSCPCGRLYLCGLHLETGKVLKFSSFLREAHSYFQDRPRCSYSFPSGNFMQ